MVCIRHTIHPEYIQFYMVLEPWFKKPILARFLGHFVLPTIRPPISSPTHEIYISRHEKDVLEVLHRLEIRRFHSL